MSFTKKLIDILKKSIPAVLCTLVLLVINMVLFQPQFDGRSLQGGDQISSIGKTHHIRQYSKEAKKPVYWNPSLFSGMPMGLLGLGKSENKFARYFNKALTLTFQRPTGLFFKAGFAALMVLLFMGLRPIYALAGGIAFGLNVNHFVLFEAGHINKILVLAVLPFVVGGLVLAWRKKYLLGAISMMIGSSLAIYFNHIQMLYYLTLALVVFGICYLVTSLIEKSNIQPLLVGSGLILAAGGVGILSNFSQLYSSKSFSEDTMRGKPVLVSDEKIKSTNSSSTKEGLNWEYAMNWSGGAKDLWTLIVPNAVGGSSAERVKPTNELAKLFIQNNPNALQNGYVRIPSYWGSLSFTGGSYYLGACIFFLFVVALLSMPRPFASAFVGGSITLMLLSMGKNAAWLNKFLFESFPLFDKFRAPVSALSVLPAVVTIGAFYGLQCFFKEKNSEKRKQNIVRGAAIAGGFCVLLLVLANTTFGYLNPNEAQYDAGVQSIFKSARKSMLYTDAFRSLFFILLTGTALWLYNLGKIKNHYLLGGLLCALVLADNVQIARRNVKNSDFIPTPNYESQFTPKQSDQYIFSQEPQGRGFYRVLDLSTNTFNDAKPSYHHNQIGGYDAAKLQRYQDMIDYYIGKGDSEVLSMLNTKYIVNKNGQVQINPNAYGNAWFVKDLVTVDNANDEIESLGQVNLRDTAVVLADEFSSIFQNITAGDGEGRITLTDYAPDRLTYTSNTSSDQVAVFSEVWYGPNKGWSATVDGKPTDHFRVNYILRGLAVPAGQHEIVFEFNPAPKGLWISRIASYAIFAFIALGIYLGVQEYQPESEPKKMTPTSKKNKAKNIKSSKRKKK